MALQELIQPWQGYAVRHIPDKPYDIYDFSYCGKSNENRWNVAGEPTLYLAREKDVALAEYARHLKINRTPQLAALVNRRKVYRFKVVLEHVLDLRELEVCASLSLQNAPFCFKEFSISRATANFIRRTTPTQGILVPSMAFLDKLEQWCLVLFLEKLPEDVKQFLPEVIEDGFFEVI